MPKQHDAATTPAAAAVHRATIVEATVDLHWIPLGAGGHSVRVNGIIFEALSATVQGDGGWTSTTAR